MLGGGEAAEGPYRSPAFTATAIPEVPKGVTLPALEGTSGER
jgi:hypothetical protein